MQLSSRPLLRVGLLVTALIAGLFAIGSARAATETASLDTGGDGFLVASEVGAAKLTFNEGDLAGQAASARFRVVDSADNPVGACPNDPLPGTTGTHNLNLTPCPDGQGFAVVVEWFDGALVEVGQAKTAAFSIDRVAPTGSIDIEDEDGFVNAAEAAAGVDVTFVLSEGADTDPVDIAVKNDALPKAPLACKFTLNNRGTDGIDKFGDPIREPATHTIPSSCFAQLDDGLIVASLVGKDPAGNSGFATSALSKLDTVAPVGSVSILDGGDGEIDDPDVLAGVDVDYAMTETGPDVTVTMSGVGASTDCEFAGLDRTGPTPVSVPAGCFDQLENGAITASLTGTDAAGNPASKSDESTLALDRTGPVVAAEIVDDDGLVNAAEAAAPAGVDVEYVIGEAAEAISDISIEVRNTAAAQSPTECRFTPTSPGTDTTDAFGNPIRVPAVQVVPKACFDDLQQGGFVVEVSGQDVHDNVGDGMDSAVLDTVAPVAVIEILDGDGAINDAEAAAGIDVNYSVSEAGPLVKVTIEDGATNTCEFEDLARNGTLNVSSTCLLSLDKGPITAILDGEDQAKNAVTKSDASALVDSVAPEASVSILDGDGIVNAAEAASGLGVKYLVGEHGEAIPDISLELRNAAAPQSPTACRFAPTSAGIDGPDPTFGNPVRTAATFPIPSACFVALEDGGVAVELSGEDGAGNVGVAVDSFVLDTTAPLATIDILDADGNIGTRDANNGVKIGYSMTEAGPGVSIEVDDATLGDACEIADLPRTGEVTLGRACLDTLDDGVITVTLTGEDLAGNPAVPAADTAMLMVNLGEVGVEILDGADDVAKGQIDSMANIAETEDGKALGVDVDLTDIKSKKVTATLTATDAKGGTATEVVELTHDAVPTTVADNIKRLTMDITTPAKLADGTLTIGVALEDALGNMAFESSTTHLDLTRPTSTWADPHPTCQTAPVPGAPPVCETKVKVSVGVSDSLRANFAGGASDGVGGTGVHVVIFNGTNATNGDTINAPGTKLSAPDQLSTNWSKVAMPSTGDWTFVVRAVDNAGNEEIPDTAGPAPRNQRKYLVAPGLEG